MWIRLLGFGTLALGCWRPIAAELQHRSSLRAAASSGITNVTCSMTQARLTTLDCDGILFQRVEPPAALRFDIWLLYVGLAFCCVVCAALAAGLTLGLTSIEEFEMRVLINHLIEEVEPGATPNSRQLAQLKLMKDQRCASRILPLISGNYFGTRTGTCTNKLDPSNQHYLLVTLLLLNATANEALPLFLDQLVPGWLACLLSVTVVLFFGEIIPSAIFTGHRQLSLAAMLSPLVVSAEMLFVPIVWPVSLLLDKILGHCQSPYSRAQIKALIRTIRADESSLEIDEANMIQGVLEMHHRKAKNIAHPLRKAKMLPHDQVLTPECVDEIMNWGHSRLFVYRRDSLCPERRDDIIGVVLVKKLLSVTFDSKHTVESLVSAMKRPVVLHPEDNLLSTLNKFQAGTCHLAVISEQPEACVAAMRHLESIPADARPDFFCSLEDVIEALLKEEIYDEEDKELGRHARVPLSDSSSRCRNLMLNVRPARPPAILRQSSSADSRRCVSERGLRTHLLEAGVEGDESSGRSACSRSHAGDKSWKSSPGRPSSPI